MCPVRQGREAERLRSWLQSIRPYVDTLCRPRKAGVGPLCHGPG